MKLKVTKYIPGEEVSYESEILKKHLEEFNSETPNTLMMRKRVKGEVKEFFTDVYFIGTFGGNFAARHWYGWGKHKDAVGNFGNFLVDESLRGQGVGSKVLKAWYEDLKNRSDLPLALFCTTGAERVALWYGKYGFRPVVEGRTFGPLYCPLGESPETFKEFCEKYYQPCEKLTEKAATVDYRHEIDCLLKFALTCNNKPFGFEKYASFEEAFVKNGLSDIVLYFNEQEHVVGWGIKTEKGIEKQLYPIYE